MGNLPAGVAMILSWLTAAGHRAVLVSAGTGYTWAATGIQWGAVS